MNQKLPTGIIVIGVLFIMLGLYAGYNFCQYMVWANSIETSFQDDFDVANKIVVSSMILIFTLLCLISAGGLLRLKFWARNMVIFILPIYTLYFGTNYARRAFGLGLHSSNLCIQQSIFEVLMRDFLSFLSLFSFPPSYLAILYIILIFAPSVIYLNRPQIKERFK